MLGFSWELFNFFNVFFPSIKLKPLLVAGENIRKCSFRFYEHQELLTQQQSNQQNINKPQTDVFIRDRGRESEEEIKPAAEQIECWWPSFMQPNLSRRHRPPRATEGWLSISLILQVSLSSSAMSEPQVYDHRTQQHKSTGSPPLMAIDLSLFLFYPLVDLVIRL